MAFITIQIDAASVSVADANQVLLAGDSTKPRNIVQNIENLLDGIKSGTVAAQITAVSSTGAGTVSGQTGGVSVTLNLK